MFSVENRCLKDKERKNDIIPHIKIDGESISSWGPCMETLLFSALMAAQPFYQVMFGCQKSWGKIPGEKKNWRGKLKGKKMKRI